MKKHTAVFDNRQFALIADLVVSDPAFACRPVPMRDLVEVEGEEDDIRALGELMLEIEKGE